LIRFASDAPLIHNRRRGSPTKGWNMSEETMWAQIERVQEIFAISNNRKAFRLIHQISMIGRAAKHPC